MQHPELPLFAFLTATLVLIPLPWHWRARNVATLSIIAWLFVVDVIFAVNSLVWAGNVNNPIPAWCDITSKIVIGASFALPLASLCICKHMEAVSSSRKVHFDSADRRRRIIFESVLCFGVPLVFMALHYIVQGHRFDIFETTGCQAALYISVPAVMLMYFPPLFFSLITLIYAVMAIHHFIRRRLTFAALLQNSNSALTTNRYLRLIALAVTEILWSTVFTAYTLYENVYPGVRPWTNWADVHSNFPRIGLFPAASLPPAFLSSMLLLWWVMPASSIIFFVFFGFGEEAMKEYRKLWQSFKRNILRRKDEKSSTLSASLPTSICPLHLVGLKNTSIEKKQLSSATTLSSSVTIAVPSSTKGDKAEADGRSLTSSMLSIYGQTTDSMPLASSQTHDSNPITISISEAYAASRPPSPVSFPSSVPPYPIPDELPMPVYQRPFSLPSVYPVSSPHLQAENGIVVTIHRQASVDNIV